MRFRYTTDQINVMFCSSSLLPIISEFFLQMSITCFRFSEWFIITVIRRLFFSRLWKILRIQLNVVVPETQVGFKFDGYFINWVREIDCLSSLRVIGQKWHLKICGVWFFFNTFMNWLDSSSIITKKKTQSINDKWIRITLAYWSVDN